MGTFDIDSKEAKEILKKGDSVDALVLYRELEKQLNVKLSDQDKKKRDDLFNLGIKRFEKNRYSEALDFFEESIKIDPYSDAWFWKGKMLEGLGDFDNAFQAYKWAIKINPTFIDPKYHLGNLCANRLKRPEMAKKIFDDILRSDKRHLGALYGRGRVLYQMGKSDEALKDFNKILNIEPGNSDALYEKGRILCQKDDVDIHEEDLPYIDSVYNKCPKNSRDPICLNALYYKGQTSSKMKRYKEAIGFFDKILSKRKRHVKALIGKGYAYSELKKINEAHEVFRIVLKIDPVNQEALLGNAKVLYKYKRIDEALQAVRTILQVNPTHNEALDLQRNILMNNGVPQGPLFKENQISTRPNLVDNQLTLKPPGASNGNDIVLVGSDSDEDPNEPSIQLQKTPVVNGKEENIILDIKIEKEQKIKEENAGVLSDKELFEKEQEAKEKKARVLSDEELFEKAKLANTIPTFKKDNTAKIWYRDPHVSEYTKRRAKGNCELCNSIAPFNNKLGFPYLEIHHIDWLSKNGLDNIENTVALCPNCHRKMHALDLPQDREVLKTISRTI